MSYKAQRPLCVLNLEDGYWRNLDAEDFETFQILKQQISRKNLALRLLWDGMK